MGILEVEPREIVVLPRGIKFQIDVDAPSRGYVLEVFEGHFQVRRARGSGGCQRGKGATTSFGTCTGGAFGGRET